MSQRLCVLFLLLLVPLSSRAFQAEPTAQPRDGTKLPVTASATLSTLNGDAKEHVYDYDTPDGSRRQLSRLDWDLKDLVMVGGQLSARIHKDITINTGLWLPLTEGRGEMHNYDWLDINSTAHTDYSLSEVDVLSGYVFDVNAAYDVLRRDELTLSAVVGYKQNGWEWSDRGVYAIYQEYGPSPIALEGENYIDYEQRFRMPYLGATANVKFKRTSLSAYLTYSPLVSATDWDHHIARTIKFKETFEGGDMIGAGARVNYPVNQTWSVFGGVDYQLIDLIIGDMEAYDYSADEYFYGDDAAGIENHYFTMTLGAELRF